jgi:methylmalonyl-CoA mutase N-terminal domain/subunit
VRTTLQALAAVLGGTQSLHTNGFDEALSLPTENAARIALRTQQILAHESGVAQTVDPLAGSFYVESMTNEIERRAEEYLATIARFDLGGKYGMLRAIERGYVQREIQNAAYGYQRTVDAKEAIVVGVNEFASEQEVAVPIQRIDEALEGRQVERVRAMRLRRDGEAHAAALRRVEDVARSGSNLMPQILLAVESYATVGEIADVLRRVFGEYRESVTV